jgi:hypothetical protein
MYFYLWVIGYIWKHVYILKNLYLKYTSKDSQKNTDIKHASSISYG